MRSWVLAAIPLALAALIAVEYVNAPRPDSTRALLLSLKEQLRFTYHDCIPLGWKPVSVHGTYYPGYTASVATYAEWLDALWRGHIRRPELASADARDVFATLNKLVSAGLLTRTSDADGYRFSLTPRAFPYYYASSVFNDNRDSLPYLCYTVIEPQHVDWIARKGRWDDVQFSWKPSAAPSWALDPVLRAHSVVLPPLTSPTYARVAYRKGQWQLANVYDRGWMMPAMGQEPINAGR